MGFLGWLLGNRPATKSEKPEPGSSDPKIPIAPRQVEGIDAYGFPDDLVGNPLLGWMGDDYVRYVAIELQRRLVGQDPGSEMVAIKCESFPIVEVSARDDGKTVRGVVLVFDLQILMRTSVGLDLRIRGGALFRAEGMDHLGQLSVSVIFEEQSTEAAA